MSDFFKDRTQFQLCRQNALFGNLRMHWSDLRIQFTLFSCTTSCFSLAGGSGSATQPNETINSNFISGKSKKKIVNEGAKQEIDEISWPLII